MPLKSTKIRNSAKGKPCTFRIPGICTHDTETTVLCHAPDKTRGKAQKTSDFWAAYGCAACHYAIDHKKAKPDWLQAIRETQEMLVAAGLISASETEKKAKKSPKGESLQGLPRRKLFQ